MNNAVTKHAFFNFVTGKKVLPSNSEDIETIITAARLDATYQILLGFKSHLLNDYGEGSQIWNYYKESIAKAEIAYKSKNLKKVNMAVNDILLDIFYEQ